METSLPRAKHEGPRWYNRGDCLPGTNSGAVQLGNVG
jgi:hypothetical protein